MGEQAEAPAVDGGEPGQLVSVDPINHGLAMGPQVAA